MPNKAEHFWQTDQEDSTERSAEGSRLGACRFSDGHLWRINDQAPNRRKQEHIWDFLREDVVEIEASTCMHMGI